MQAGTAPRIEAVNDFVIKFANVNGSGSASANELFARSLLRMGVPVSPRNIFPSQHPGPADLVRGARQRARLPGRRGGVDLMVAMNPQTWDRTSPRSSPAATCSTTARKPLPPSKFRDDIHVLGVPLTEICDDALHRSAPAPAVQEHRLRRRAGGAARRRARGDRDAARRAVQGQGQAARSPTSTPSCWAATTATSTSTTRSACRSSARDAVGNRIFIDGNAAAALGCVYGGATVCAWYPITPCSSLAEAFQKYCAQAPRRQGDRQQQVRDRPGRGRDRLDRHRRRRRLERRARVHGDLGPGRLADDRVHRPGLLRRDPGRRSSTCSAAARRPACRRARSRPTSCRCAYASHGDTKHVLLFPEDPHECFDFAARGARPRRPPADADLRHDRPRHRHEPAPVRAVRLGRRAQLRPRQGDDRRGARGRQGLRPLQGRRRRRHPVPHAARHAPDARALLHARHHARRLRALFRARARTTSTTWSAC